MKKKLFTIIVAFVMMTSFIVEVYAEEAQDNYGVEPFYTNTSLVTANLRLSGATAICNAQNVMTKNKKSKITMTLQKSSDKSTYSKVKAWSQESTGTGNKTLEKMLETLAEVFSESTSCFGLYEPKVPEKLVEKKKKNV